MKGVVLRRAGTGALTLLAVLLVWFGLTAPNRISSLTPGAFVRIPLEALLVVAVVLFLPPRGRRVTAVLVGVILGLLTITKLLDMGFFEALGRSFDVVVDWRYLGSAVSLLDDSVGRSLAVVLLLVMALLVVAILVLMPLSVLRLTRIASRHRETSLRAVMVVGLVWVLFAVLGMHLVPGVPVASASAAEYAYGQVSRIPSEIRDQREFAKAAADDPLRDVPADRLLTGLRGKDVIVAFVESYGRIAVQDSQLSLGVDKVLDDGTRTLGAHGFSARSAFLTSPTFGAISWLAHSTLQTGLWVDSQQRYDAVVASDRFTLSGAFKRAGWRTVGDSPANTHDWPQGAFYGYDKLYDSRNVGYAGPRFGYPTMPDQYTFDAFHRLELSKPHRKPVMAEIDLISSHAPWSRTPQMIDQSAVGDGSVFEGMPERAPSKTEIWSSPERVRTAYGESIEYSLNALITFVESYGDDNLVLLLLGDHQPATIVSGEDSGRDVPVTLVTRDPHVLDRIAGWGWQDGLNPGPDAPVWRMDAFRDRFLAAYGP
ncbi:MAG: Conserved putative rane protein [Marmoricola sp.]|nr:Conserved putative rane protein [Marmoricola sp.]